MGTKTSIANPQDFPNHWESVKARHKGGQGVP